MTPNATCTPTSMTFDALREEALRALAEGGYGDGVAHDGRVVAVKTTPLKGNGSDIVVGTAALPAGYRTPPMRLKKSPWFSAGRAESKLMEQCSPLSLERSL